MGVAATENGLRKRHRRRQIKRQMRKLWIRTAWRLPKGAGVRGSSRSRKGTGAGIGTVAAAEVADADRGGSVGGR